MGLRPKVKMLGQYQKRSKWRNTYKDPGKSEEENGAKFSRK
jgi:hypothetical protein